MITKEHLERARLLVRRHFARSMPKWMVFHDLEHTLSVARHAVDIGRASHVGAAELRLLEMAALFHDAGYAEVYKGHEQASAVLAGARLAEWGVPKATATRVQRLIMATRMHARPRTLLQGILRDADSAKAGQVDFIERAERLRLELEHVLGKPIRARAWTLENIAYLVEHRFHTAYARRRFGPQKATNLKALEERLAQQRKLRSAPVRAAPFYNRDISWLAFNARVLQEAQDERTPLLERLKFLAIHSSNLDEFYRVRVAQLRSLEVLGRTDRSALEAPPDKLIARINRTALAQQQALGAAFRGSVVPGLAAEGIRFLAVDDLSKPQRTFARRYFNERIAPLLQTVALRTGNAPFIEDRKLYLACELVSGAGGKRRTLLINVPSEELGRFIMLPATKGRKDVLLLEDAIRLCLPKLFPQHRTGACHAVKLSRDAELYLDEELAGEVADKVRRSLRKRRTGVPARFLYDAQCPPRLLRKLREVLGLRKAEMIPGGRYHNFSDLVDLPVKGPARLRYPEWPPLAHPRAMAPGDPFAHMRQGDMLLHYPYHDFGAFTRVLRHAAKDPAVTAISITLYRVARTSVVCEALLLALKNGKRVTAHVEVQARFDEANNLHWGEALAAAGARVTYGRQGRKVHCKLCLFDRREGGRAVRYAYLGTGNFNERTSTVYGDMGLFTADGAMVRDVAAVFAMLDDPEREPRLRHLLVAPDGLRAALERELDAEIARALAGRPAAVLLKMNGLEDRPLIRKLYDASRAGVRVRLIIRGICCLVPGLKDHSANIQAISIVDRYLEHARAYVFHNNGHPRVYLSSADWMQRNMDRRVEVAFPVLDPALQAEVLRFLEVQWADMVKARIIDERQTNRRRRPAQGAKALRAQEAWYKALKAMAP